MHELAGLLWQATLETLYMVCISGLLSALGGLAGGEPPMNERSLCDTALRCSDQQYAAVVNVGDCAAHSRGHSLHGKAG
jgi:hypothetical protein